MNSEQVEKLVNGLIMRAQKIQSHQHIDLDQGIQAEPEAIDALTDAMRIVLSRPDQDGTRSDLFTRVRLELQDLNSLGDCMKRLSTEAIQTLNNKSAAVRDQMTEITLMNNMLAELHPEALSNSVFKQIFESTRDAKIKVSDKVKNDAFLKSMSVPASPSETATTLLKSAPPAGSVDSKVDAKNSEKKKKK